MLLVDLHHHYAISRVIYNQIRIRNDNCRISVQYYVFKRTLLPIVHSPDKKSLYINGTSTIYSMFTVYTHC